MKIDREITAQDTGLAEIVTRVVDTLRRRWLIMTLVSLGIFGLGVTLVMMMTPQYSATARVRIDPSRNPLNKDAGQAQESLSPEAIETEVTTINSLDLARKVVRDLKLGNAPEFTKGVQAPEGTVLSPGDRELALAANPLKKLDVGRDKLTYILDISFDSRDPLMAARVANGFADSYLASKVGSDSGAAQRQAGWFRKQLADLGEEVRAADAQVARYRAQAGIAEGGNNGARGITITDQQISPISTELASAQSEAAAANAILAAARAQAVRGASDSISEVLSSSVITDLRRQRAEILRNMGEIQARYGERHPESVKVRDQLASIDMQIKDETSRVLASLRSSALAANARVASLQGTMNDLAGKQASNTQASVLALSLEREADAKRAQYEKLAQLSMDSTQKAQNSIGTAEIIERAKTPMKPSSPNKPLLIALALIVGIAAGSGIITVQELMVTGFRSKDELERRLNLPLLAAVPAVPRAAHPADMLLDKPTSFYSESFRIARASILGVRVDKQPQVIAFTSALPGEGKTTTALSFARVLAINGAKTLLIECDVRRAVMRNQVRAAPASAGLIEVLNGSVALESTIAPGDVPGLDQLLVMEPHFSAGNMFGDGQMARVLKTLRAKYTHIVLDLPPLVGLADGRFLAALADTTVLVVRWNSTPIAASTNALEWLQSDGVSVAGAILTMIDPGAQAAGGLYYAKEYAGYYQKS
ncbi:polysaccharide biosynthesis tyrosine autokinase [soil metagenome]